MNTFRDGPRPVRLHQGCDLPEASERRFQIDLEWNHEQTESTIRRVHVYASRRPTVIVAAQVTSDAVASIFVARTARVSPIWRRITRSIRSAAAIRASFR